ncbi:MAG: hypothetical protein V8S95_03560 [Odoribacter sp.]
MKCIFLLCCLGGLYLGTSAQETTISKNADSLQQVINNLSSQLQQQKDAEQNRAIWKNRAKYFNIGYVKSTLSDEEGEELKNDWGASISWGRTYYLHKKPLFGMLKFGLDWSWIDMNYAMYKIEEYGYDDSDYDGDYTDYNEDEDSSTNIHHAEIGMSFGPSLTVNPVGHLKINAYFRFTPSFSAVYLDEIGTSYATFFNVGAALSYKVISIGVENRWGQGKYKNLIPGDYDEITEEELPSPKLKLQTNSLRAYISFRF